MDFELLKAAKLQLQSLEKDLKWRIAKYSFIKVM